MPVDESAHKRLSLAELLDAVPSLNTPEREPRYRVEGEAVVGEWHRVEGEWRGPLGPGRLETDYTVTVAFDEQARQYRMHQSEVTRQSGQHLPGTDGSVDATRRFLMGDSGLSGMVIEVVSRPPNESSRPGVYSVHFDNRELRRPLVELIESSGWTKKPGVFGRLFGRRG